MNVAKELFWAVVFVMALGLAVAAPVPVSAAEPVLVGRIAYIDGQLLRYIPDTQDWVAEVKDAPFGLNDALYSAENGRDEFIFPNGISARIGSTTQIQLIAIESDASEMDVASGIARFYNRSANGMLKVTTPFGYVLAEPESSFDVYVGDQSIEVIAFNGTVSFIHLPDNTGYDVAQAGGSIIADASQVASGDGKVDAQWDDWNASRDNLWAQRAQVKGESAQFVPAQIHDDDYVLEENGKWEKVLYQGEYHEFWRPTGVSETWAPFTVGRWTDYYGDQVWVPEEPFGYVTHHYGNWMLIDGRWLWAPPAPAVTVAVGPTIGFGWYPGRVAWIHTGAEVGWVPLAPAEVYYSHHHWGPSAVLVTSAPSVNIAIGSLAFISAAVVVPQASFYSVPNYTSVRVTNINQTTIINNYHAAPLVNNTVVTNYSTNTNRYNFTNTAVAQKPHSEVIGRIQQNQAAATQASKLNAGALKQTATAAKTAKPLQQAAIAQPKVTNKIVPANQVNLPKNQVQFKPAQVKQNTKPAASSSAAHMPPVPGQHPAGPQQVQPAKPAVPPPSPGVTTKPGVQPPAGATQAPAGGAQHPAVPPPTGGTPHPPVQPPPPTQQQQHPSPQPQMQQHVPPPAQQPPQIQHAPPPPAQQQQHPSPQPQMQQHEPPPAQQPPQKAAPQQQQKGKPGEERKRD